VRTIELVVTGLIPGFELLPGAAGRGYTLVKDLFEVLVLVGVAMAVFRRLFARPKRLDLSLDAWIILFLIALLMVTDLLAEGARTALAGAPPSPWAPAVGAVAAALAGVLAGETARGFTRGPVVAASARPPLLRQTTCRYSKHFHISTSIPNIFFMNREPMGKLKTVDLENIREGRELACVRGPDLEADARRIYPAPSASRWPASSARRLWTGKPLGPQDLHSATVRGRRLRSDWQGILSETVGQRGTAPPRPARRT
jgi:hypothetical protein